VGCSQSKIAFWKFKQTSQWLPHMRRYAERCSGAGTASSAQPWTSSGGTHEAPTCPGQACSHCSRHVCASFDQYARMRAATHANERTVSVADHRSFVASSGHPVTYGGCRSGVATLTSSWPTAVRVALPNCHFGAACRRSDSFFLCGQVGDSELFSGRWHSRGAFREGPQRGVRPAPPGSTRDAPRKSGADRSLWPTLV
jgi:hypothetical protein